MLAVGVLTIFPLYFILITAFKTRVTNPRGKATTTSFQAWDAPTAGARPEALRRVKYTYPNVRFARTPTDPYSVLTVAEGA